MTTQGPILDELAPIAITTTGSAGSATGSGESALVRGYLEAIYIDYNASAPATTVITIQDNAGRTLWTGDAGNTDGMVYPRDSNTSERIPFASRPIVFAISASDALAPAVTITPIVLV